MSADRATVPLDEALARTRVPGLTLAIVGLFHGLSIILSAFLPVALTSVLSIGTGSSSWVQGYAAVLLAVIFLNGLAAIALVLAGWGMVNARSQALVWGGSLTALPLVVTGGLAAFFLVPGCGTFFLLGTTIVAMVACVYAWTALMDAQVAAAFRHQARRAAQERGEPAKPATLEGPGRR